MIQFDYTDQLAIVTGGTRGIGKAIAEAFLAAGGRVIATYARNTDAAEAMRAGLPADVQSRLQLTQLDAADHGAVEAWFRELERLATTPQILVNNAGIRRDNALAMLAFDDWEAVLRANLTGSFVMSKFAVQAMMGARYGRIINITSPAGRFGFQGQANYSASKAGQVGMARSLSKEVAKRGITVNCVSPGFIETDLLDDLTPDQVKAYKSTVPLRRFGTPAEVANAVLYLASKEASYITGATLEVAGGL